MSISLNRISLIGHLTKKPNIRQTPSGVNVTDLDLQVKQLITKDDGTQQMMTSFHTITAWRWLAETADKYCSAGTQIYVDGRLQTDEWEDETGQKRQKTKVVADNLLLVDSKNPQTPTEEISPVISGLNRAEVVGNLTRDPELRQTPNGNYVCSFGIATNRRWRDKTTEEQKESVEYHNIVVWGELAQEISKKIKKGQKAFVAGRCTTRSWETPEGNKRWTTEIVSNQVYLLGVSDPTITGNATNTGNFPDLPPEAMGESIPKNNQNKSGGGEVIEDNLPEIPEITHESEIKPEDLPF